MGWNSWDAYGLTIDEAGYKANTSVLAELRPFGWEYSVIDEGWYMHDPFAGTVPARQYVWNQYGLLIPDQGRFPSSAHGAGFKPLAGWVHARGLKFGIHIVRGIPRQVVAANLPIEGTSFHAREAADETSPCPWDHGNWGVKDNAAGQAYYDSMLKLYAAWGVDYIKVDCISARPYRPTEIRQIAEAIRKTGRPMVLSLSPGPTALQDAEEVARYAQLWRIADDHWDGWTFKHEPGAGEFPFGLKDEFDRIAAWSRYTRPGAWPDPDMLPEGRLAPHPGWGQPRQSNYTPDEQRTEFTLWAISRAPLILGANLAKLDTYTRSMLTNKALLAVNQHAAFSHPLEHLPANFGRTRVWEAGAATTPCAPRTYAFFNLDDKPSTLTFAWNDLDASPGGACRIERVRNLWDGSSLDASGPAQIALPPHGSAVFSLSMAEAR